MLEVGETLSGFTIESREPVAEIDGEAFVARHACGARLLYLRNDDVNKAFSIAFKTPPVDDTGVFHILEHSVLCGSRKFPVKEPFVNLLKSSMQTFLNALTFPDKTMYPVASTNEQDLINLVDVYMDAVLHPRIFQERAIFEQEGWHVEIEEAAEGVVADGAEALPTLSYNGVVYNEMKGALADPESVLYHAMNRALYPDSCYAFESGGRPSAIPELTYEDFLDAHRRHYRSDNSYIVLYGDMDIERMLAFLNDEYLSAVEEAQGEPNPVGQIAPRMVEYESVPMQTSPENATAGLGYVVGSAHDFERGLATSILLDALMGGNESPIKRVILDAGIGGDCSAFLADAQAYMTAVFVLRNAQPDSAQKFRQIIEDRAAVLVRDGIPRDVLQASLSQLEFAVRERDRGIADGVALAMDVLACWIYNDDDATLGLRYEELFKRMREGLDGRYFEDLLESIVCNTQHSALVEVVPVEQLEEDEATRVLKERELALTDEQAQTIRDDVAALRARQEAPDAPEDVAKLPRLHVSDIKPAKPWPDFALREDGPLPCLQHMMSTHGIDYFNAYFDLKGIAWEDLPYVRLLCMLLGALETETHTAAEVDTWSRTHLGSLRFSLEISAEYKNLNAVTPRLKVTSSALSEQLVHLGSIPREVWETTCFTDATRIHSILVQRRVAIEQAMMLEGHSAAMQRAESYVFPACLFQEQTGGVDFYLFLRDLIDHYDERAEDLAQQLERVRSQIFVADRFTGSFAGSEKDYDIFWKVAGTLGLVYAGQPDKLVFPEPVVKREAFVVPTDVVYVAQAADVNPLGEFNGIWSVAGSALSLDYLWNEVRVKGGAYGSGFRRTATGCARFYSYRDPRIDETLERYAQAGEWLASFEPDADELEGYIVAIVAGRDAPLKPRAIAQRQDLLYFGKFPEGYRERLRQEVLEATPEQVRACAPAVTALGESPAVCVFGNADLIDASTADFTRVDLLG